MSKGILLVIILAAVIAIFAGIVLWPEESGQNNRQKHPIVAGIQVNSPKANAEVSSPIKIAGTVSGNGWMGFEGQAGNVELSLGDETPPLGRAVLRATTDWTKLPISFEAVLEFSNQIGPKEGKLVFRNENPSGDPSKDKIFSLPVKIK